MQVHTNGICILLSNRYENAVLSVAITGYGGVAVWFGHSKLAVWTFVKEDNKESAIITSVDNIKMESAVSVSCF